MERAIPKKRLSNIELLRIIAMFLVLIVHADYFSLGAPSKEDVLNEPLDAFLRIFFEAISIVCVNVFVLISGWFGIKPTVKGLCNFLFQCFFFLIGTYVVTLILGTSTLSIEGIAGCVFATKMNWFIKAYLLLYILSPVLNAFINNSTQSEYKYVLIAFFLFSCTYGWSGAADFMSGGLSPLFFIGLYLLARYLKIYAPFYTFYKKNVYFILYLADVVLVTLLMFLPPLLLNKSVPGVFWNYLAPTTIFGALCLLLGFSKLKIKNDFINWCAISCFSVFLMHVSPSILWHFKALFVKLHALLSPTTFWVATIGILILIFIVSILIDKIRIMIWNYCWSKIEK